MLKRYLKTVKIQQSRQERNLSLDTEQSIILEKPSTELVSWVATSTAATNFYIYVSIDGTNYYKFLEKTSVTKWADSAWIAFPYVMLKADAAAGATADLLLATA